MAIEFVRFETADDVEQYIIKNTKARRDAKKDVEKDVTEVKLSEFATGLLSVWEKADFGCQKPHVAQILHLMVKQSTGEDVSFKKRNDSEETREKPEQYTLVVMTRNCNGHDYGEVPFVVLSRNPEERGLKGDGSYGNHPATNRNAFRYATDIELDEFFKNPGRIGSKILSSGEEE